MNDLTKYNMRVFTIIGLLSVSLLFSCQSSRKKEQIKTIELQEETLYETPVIDLNKGKQLIESYVTYSKQFPQDTLSAVYLFKAGEIAMNLKLANQSIVLFDKVITNYSTYSKAPECLFLKAFVFENQLNDLTKAGKLYNEFIAKYPNHTLVKDAKASLEYLGKSPEELVKMFQEKNKTQ